METKNNPRAGKTREQIEQIREALEEKDRLFVYGLLDPNRYLDQLGEEYTAKEVFRTEYCYETEKETSLLIGHTLCKVKSN